MPDGALSIVVGVAGLILPAAVLALVMRHARLFGRGSDIAAAVAGGVLWGVLAGPGVFGRSWPEVHHRVFVGGENQRETLQRLRREQAIELAVLQSSGATPEAVDEQRLLHSADSEPAEAALRDALADRRRVFDFTGLAFAASTIGLGIALRLSRPMRCPASDGRTALLAGLSAVLIPAAVGALAASVGTGAGGLASLSFGACVGVGWVVPSVRTRLVGAAGRAPTSDTACLTAASVGWLAVGALGKSILAFIGGLCAAVAGRPAGRKWGRGVTRAIRALLYGLFAPGACAFAASRVDPYAVGVVGSFWIAAGIAIVISSDGRWTMIYAAWRLQRPEEPRRLAAQRASAYVLSGAGLSQCTAAFTLHAAGLIREIDLAALLLAAVTLESAAGLYRILARNSSDDQGDGDVLPGVPPDERVSPN